MQARGPAVVIGGASGIGAAVVARLRAAETPTVVWDRRGTPDIVCDISDPAGVDVATAATLDHVGVPSQVTITAGVGHSGPLATASPDEWDQVMAVNAKGVWLAMRGLGQAMVGAGQGSIVAVSSVSAQLADRTMGLYCTSKAALDMVVKVAAVEWSPVRVNAVAPGVTDTPMLGPIPRTGSWLSAVAQRTALGRLGHADDIAEAIMAVHSMAWMTGQVVVCDGGLVLHSPIDPPG
ncbi:MAG TPA: SDR family oxidoreductase [Acidimicrobiales bacterium]|nr:SDR family oxidoreductase [Acidimicrobiales bacterium]